MADLNGVMDVATDAAGNVYLTGIFTGNCSFGKIPLAGTATQGYVARYGTRVTGHYEADHEMAVSVFPNPVQNQFLLRLTNPVPAVRATLYNAQGHAVAAQALLPPAAKATEEPAADAAFDTSALPDGLYLLRLDYAHQTTTRAVRVQH